MFKFIGRHWRGDANFWLSVALSIVLPISIIAVGSQWVGIDALQDTPQSRLFQAAALFSLLVGVGIWQLIGTWRASSKNKAPARWMLTRWVARVTALAMAATALVFASVLPKAMTELYATATDTDKIGQQGYSVTVDGDRLIVSGAFARGLLDKAERALAENKQIQIAVLEGPGGHVGVGTRLGDMIKAHGLDTLTNEFCASACTEAFIWGKNRYLRSGAKLGFHSVSGESKNAIVMGKRRALENLRAAGLTEDFIARSFEVPGDRLWYPTYDELREANVITEIVE
jgi:hypothetical protein